MALSNLARHRCTPPSATRRPMKILQTMILRQSIAGSRLPNRPPWCFTSARIFSARGSRRVTKADIAQGSLGRPPASVYGYRSDSHIPGSGLPGPRETSTSAKNSPI
jgi:hypothetical protein